MLLLHMLHKVTFTEALIQKQQSKFSGKPFIHIKWQLDKKKKKRKHHQELSCLSHETLRRQLPKTYVLLKNFEEKDVPLSVLGKWH